MKNPPSENDDPDKDPNKPKKDALKLSISELLHDRFGLRQNLCDEVKEDLRMDMAGKEYMDTFINLKLAKQFPEDKDTNSTELKWQTQQAFAQFLMDEKIAPESRGAPTALPDPNGMIRIRASIDEVSERWLKSSHAAILQKHTDEINKLEKNGYTASDQGRIATPREVAISTPVDPDAEAMAALPKTGLFDISSLAVHDTSKLPKL